MKTTVTKRFEFSYAHILPYHSGKCSRLHGHNAMLDVEVSGEVADVKDEHASDEGMVIDFSLLKEVVNVAVVNRWDHRFLANGDEWVYQAGLNQPELAPAADLVSQFDVSDQFCLLKCRTTAENLAERAFRLIEDKLENWEKKPAGLRLESVTFWETPTSSATFRKVR